MANPLGPLGPADERLDHQIPDTFATVGVSDPSWTEKVCAMAARRDGTLQLGFGMGKYTNRNVLDGYAGLSRGPEQITVRGSRRLYPSFDESSVGPIRYEVLEPMKRVRFSLDPNDCQPVAFEWTFEGVVPPATEERTHQRTPLGYRVSADLVRYHQIGIAASGWIEIDGRREEITPEEWVSTRDHSWGVRYDVGTPPTDVDPFNPVDHMDFQMIWSPVLMTEPDGTRWGLFMHLIDMRGFGHHSRTVMGEIEHADGRVERMADIRPRLEFDPVNRRLRGGEIAATLEDGSERSFSVEVPTDTGFHLGAGLYFGYKGHHHGEWRGELNVEGERIEDCRVLEVARDLHQLRDTFVVVRDQQSGAVGCGNCQPMVTGSHPNLGLDRDSSFL
jgi:hypothetical protein